MKLYADSSRRFALQLGADFAILCWLVFWVWLGTVVHDGIESLADPGDRIAAAADDLADSMDDAGAVLDDAPVIGDEAAAPFESAAEASGVISDAGEAEASAARRLAFWAGVLVALLPIAFALRRYLPWRVGFVLDASAAARVVSGGDLELFAWRAVARQPLWRVARVTDDPVTALRQGDAEVVARLARLELAELGVRPPASGRGAAPARA